MQTGDVRALLDQTRAPLSLYPDRRWRLDRDASVAVDNRDVLQGADTVVLALRCSVLQGVTLGPTAARSVIGGA
jgi:hypothetical protein